MTPDLHIAVYNIFYTGGIPFIIATFDQILPARILESKPHLYQHSSKMKIYTKKAYWATVLDACK